MIEYAEVQYYIPTYLRYEAFENNILFVANTENNVNRWGDITVEPVDNVNSWELKW